MAGRAPQQDRSRRRVALLLDTAERMLVQDGAAALTATQLARAAGVPVGSFYAYFDDVDALLRALVECYAVEFEQVAADFARADVDGDPLAAALHVFADAFRARPAFRAIWFSGLRTEAMRDVAREALIPIAAAFTTVIARAHPEAPRQDVAQATEMVVFIADALLRQAFRRDADGDATLLAETELVLHAYVTARLGA
jgi:AcrR family transcriptional regulator